MKTRYGFVSNSSSSSFIAFLDCKPTSEEHLHELLFGTKESFFIEELRSGLIFSSHNCVKMFMENATDYQHNSRWREDAFSDFMKHRQYNNICKNMSDLIDKQLINCYAKQQDFFVQAESAVKNRLHNCKKNRKTEKIKNEEIAKRLAANQDYSNNQNVIQRIYERVSRVNDIHCASILSALIKYAKINQKFLFLVRIDMNYSYPCDLLENRNFLDALVVENLEAVS